MGTKTLSNRTANLVRTVTSVPGVVGIEPGIATTLRTLDSRVRGEDADAARFGVVIDDEAGTVTVEVGVDRTLPVRQVVRDVQEAVIRDLGGSGIGTSPTTGASTAECGGSDVGTGNCGDGGRSGSGGSSATRVDGRTDEGGTSGIPAVTVRVQSLSR